MEEINGIPVYEFMIDEVDDNFGVSVMSLVDDPAVEKNFIALSKHKKLLKLSLNDEKRIITGVALRADFPIYRNDNGKEYFFVISKEEMVRIVQKFMREKRTDQVNLMHDTQNTVDGVYLIESFIFTEEHKGIYPEFADVEPGSWIVSYKVDNEEVWQSVKEGKLKGFSVEMYGILGEKETKENELLTCLLNYLIYESKKKN